VECLRGASAIMAGTEYGHIAGILLHLVERGMPCDIYARPGGTSMLSASALM
jgi:hypothetical protein